MVFRGLAGGLGFVLVLLGWATLFAQDGQPRPLTKQQQDELQAIYGVVSATEQGQAAPNDLSIEWTGYDVLMKVLADRHYTPFTVTIDPSGVTAKELTVYWRVVAKEPAVTDAPESPGEGAPTSIVYEDMNTAMVAPAAPQAIRRFFTVPAGDYDVHVVVKAAGDGDEPQMSYLSHSVTVPDYWNDELTTSAVILADSIEPLSVPLTPQQQAERPYALGPMEIVPARDTQFSTLDQLQTFMLIYNARTDAQNKPDVTVEYSFYAKRDGGAEAFFNKTNPQALNARTLPPYFDMAAGHQLQSAQAVPLGSFPAGDYRLEIKVTDKLADMSLTRDVSFSVTSS